MQIVKQTPRSGDTVMLGSPRLRPAYLNGTLWEVARETARGFDCTLRTWADGVTPPRNRRFFLGCTCVLRYSWLVGVVTEQDETEEAA